MSNQEVTLDEVIKAMEGTEKLLSKLRRQQMNPGLPLHLAPKGRKPKSRKRTSSKPKSRKRTSSKPKSRKRTSSKPKSRTRTTSKPKSRTTSKPKSRTTSKPKSRTTSKPKSRTTSKAKLREDIQLKKKQIEELGVDTRQLFGLDNDELNALLENPQLIKSMAPYRESFLPPDDSPRRTPPSGFYEYPPNDNPNDPATLRRNVALARPDSIGQEPLPEKMRPRFG